MAIPAGLLLSSCVSVLVNPAKAWLLVPLEILFWPLLLVNLFLAIWAVFRKSRAIVIPVLAMLPACFFLGRFIQFKGGEGSPEDSIKVISYNVGRFRSYPRKMDARTCQDSVIAFLRRTDADIICLQEFYMLNGGGQAAVLLGALMKGYKPAYYLYTGKKGRFGNVTLSRYPIKDKGHIDFDSSVNLAVWSDCRIGTQTIRVYNCHLESYNISPAGILENLRGKRDKEVLEDTGRKMRRSIKHRASQVDKIFTEMDNSPVPSIICGDFNDPPLSYTYHKTMRGHKDCFREAGSGIGASYPSTLPTVRLDYILIPREMQATGYDCPAVKYSDHRPVVAEISFKNSDKQ